MVAIYQVSFYLWWIGSLLATFSAEKLQTCSFFPLFLSVLAACFAFCISTSCSYIPVYYFDSFHFYSLFDTTSFAPFSGLPLPLVKIFTLQSLIRRNACDILLIRIRITQLFMFSTDILGAQITSSIKKHYDRPRLHMAMNIAYKIQGQHLHEYSVRNMRVVLLWI